MSGDSFGETLSNYILALIGAACMAIVVVLPVVFFSSLVVAGVLDSVFDTGIRKWYDANSSTGMFFMCLASVGISGIFMGGEMTKDKLDGEVSGVQSKYEAELKESRLARERAESQYKEISWYAQALREGLGKQAAGFKALHESVAELDKLVDDGLAGYLENKRRPAFSAADTVKRETKMRRIAEVEARVARSIIEYYEQMFPELAEIRQNELEGGGEQEADNAYTERERQDPVTRFIAKAEYSRLTPQQRNQLALDRYWKRRHSPKELGRMYERYVGYLYESKGYTVSYTGIKDGLSDLGRDLVCTKGKTVEVVQCKYWSQYKSVYENRIFQHFGTVFEYKMQHKGARVIPVFYTTTKLSDTARRFAEAMKMRLVEMHKFDKSYPCIKCNIGRDGSKIYHLPFDQQYDKVNIELDKGEFFAKTVKEAEDAGFRRAYRWRGGRS